MLGASIYKRTFLQFVEECGAQSMFFLDFKVSYNKSCSTPACHWLLCFKSNWWKLLNVFFKSHFTGKAFGKRSSFLRSFRVSLFINAFILNEISKSTKMIMLNPRELSCSFKRKLRREQSKTMQTKETNQIRTQMVLASIN